MNKHFFIFFFTLQALAFPSRCLKDFKKLTPGELRYVTEGFQKKHNTRYSVEIDQTRVSDQCGYGSCWVHARLSHLEEDIKRRMGKEIPMSRHFVIAQSLLDRIDEALQTPHASIFQGGNSQYADRLIKSYGMVPDDPSIWKPRVQFEKSPHAGRLVYFLNARAAQFHEDAKDLAPESKAYLDLQDAARKEMRDILRTYTGTLPKKFVIDGKSYTPKSFAKTVLKDANENPLLVYPEVKPLTGNLRKETSVTEAPLPDKPKSSRESIEKMEKRIIRALQNGQSVTLSYENNTHFVDRDSGIMSIEAFNTPKGFSPPPKLYRDAFMRDSGYHAVDIVGADLDPEGRIIKLKIKNSWGVTSGDHGYYHMYRDYFESFVNSIYISDSGSPSQLPEGGSR
ncbi:MAG: C1 family peptidase [Pseudomonadota bacterium]